MPRHDGCKLADRPRLRVPLQEKVQHCHEVALPAAEAPVQVGRLARPPLERPRMNDSASAKHETSCGVTT